MLKKLSAESQKFIRALQRSGDGRKKRWLIFGTTLIMLIVVATWIYYLNLTLPNSNKKLAATDKDASDSKEESFGEVLKRCVQTIKKDATEKFAEIKSRADLGFETIKNQLEQTNEFSIEAAPQNLNQEIPNQATSSETEF